MDPIFLALFFLIGDFLNKRGQAKTKVASIVQHEEDGCKQCESAHHAIKVVSEQPDFGLSLISLVEVQIFWVPLDPDPDPN